MKNKINVIGLGYIGLPTALMMAKSGVNVVGTDINEEVVKKLNMGELTFEEKKIDQVFTESLKNGIEFSTEYIETDTYIVTVPTPYIKESKKLDASYVISAVKSVLDICKDESILVIESTISPGTIDKYVRPIIKESSKKIDLVHAPERIIPGNMIYELEYNSRTIGADSIEAGESVKELYSSFCKGEMVITDIRTAEMTKVIENTYRDINIAFANELAKICSSDNLDVYEIIRIANMHPRVNILEPGPGVGGHCISVDPWFLVGDYPEQTKLIKMARKINDSMPEHVLGRIQNIMAENDIKDYSKVGIYGLTYKENVDDVRESPGLQLMEKMKNESIAEFNAYDPHVKATVVDNQLFDFSEFLEKSEIIVILVAHDHIKDNKNLLKNKHVLDTKNIIGKETYRL